MFKLHQIDHVGIHAADVERSAKWYNEVLGLDVHRPETPNSPVEVVAGTTGIALFPADDAHPVTTDGWHLAFKTDRAGFDAAQADLVRRGIEFRFADHGYSRSIYFPDPDGYRLEITTYER